MSVHKQLCSLSFISVVWLPVLIDPVVTDIFDLGDFFLSSLSDESDESDDEDDFRDFFLDFGSTPGESPPIPNDRSKPRISRIAAI